MNHSTPNISPFASISKISFFFFLFFSVFGTSLPFMEVATDLEDIGTSNLINQSVYSILFITSLFGLLHKKSELLLLIRTEKFLSLFLIWCLLSIIWSDYSFVSFKRLFQILTTVTVSLAFLLNTDSSEESLSYFKLIFFTFIILSILAVQFIPDAIHSYGAWRGLTSQKNQLGQAALVSIIIWCHSLMVDMSWRKCTALILMLVSFILLVGSRSMTSIITLFILASISLVLFIDNQLLKTLGIGRSFSFLLMMSILGSVVTIIFLAPDIIMSLPAELGRDISLTGRTDVWSDILEIAKSHIFIGCGFGGFWVTNNTAYIYLQEKYFTVFNQAHMGYIDILNETGFIGLSMFVLMVMAYFKNLLKLNKSNFWGWLIICTLIVNFAESTLFRQGTLMGNMFIFSYLALYADSINKREL